MLDAEFDTRGMSRVIAPYDQLLHDWRPIAASIATHFGFAWPRNTLAAAREIDRHLDSTHRHHHFEVADLRARRNLVAWISSAYEALLAIGERGQHSQAHITLNSIRIAFDTAYGALGPLFFEAKEALPNST